jgi:hypothetical protein
MLPSATLRSLRCIQRSTNSTRALTTSSTQSSWFFSKDREKSAGHSSLISKDQSVYEIVTETVVPSEWDSYVKHKQLDIQALLAVDAIRCNHVASWGVVTGDTLFKAVHLFKYDDGWSDFDDTRKLIKQNKDYQDISRAGLHTITSKHAELTKAFSFWPSPDTREGGNVYDIRSYSLKPGSMYDWSNYWARGIQHRSAVRKDVPYAGFFTQLGKLHTIYHIWCYKSLADRKACREGTWAHPEWNDIVANTVPLVKTMNTKIVEPLPFSPTQ